MPWPAKNSWKLRWRRERRTGGSRDAGAGLDEGMGTSWVWCGRRRKATGQIAHSGVPLGDAPATWRLFAKVRASEALECLFAHRIPNDPALPRDVVAVGRRGARACDLPAAGGGALAHVAGGTEAG